MAGNLNESRAKCQYFGFALPFAILLRRGGYAETSFGRQSGQARENSGSGLKAEEAIKQNITRICIFCGKIRKKSTKYFKNSRQITYFIE